MLQRASRFSESVLCKRFVLLSFLSTAEQVTFVGEGAIDDGGPRLEFFRLLADAAAQNYFKGVRGGHRFFDTNITAVQVRL